MNEQNKFDTVTGAAAPENAAPRAGKHPAAQSDAPRRRVGSLTLGFCLIAAGIFFLCYSFVPDFDWMLVVRIAPAAALVLLGCEVLFFAARPGRWKYDFVSVLVCLGLIAVCMCLSFVPVVWSQIDPSRQQTAAKLGKAYTAEVYDALREEVPGIGLKDVYTDLYLYTSTVDDLQDLEPGDGNLRLQVTLFGPYASAEDFARDCRAVTSVIQKQAVQPDALIFECDVSGSDATVRKDLDVGSLQQTQDYELELYGTTQLDWTVEQMTRQTSVTDLLAEENEPEPDASEETAPDDSPVEEAETTAV